MKIIRPRRVTLEVQYELYFELADNPERGYAFSCDAQGNVVIVHRISEETYRQCLAGAVDGQPVIPRGVRSWKHRRVEEAAAECDRCQGEAIFFPNCGAYVCFSCGNHLGLARCYCGWSATGGDGRNELIEMGETIDPD